MSGVAFHRLLRWNLRSSLRWWWPVAAGVLCCFIGWRSALQAAALVNSSQTQVTANVWDAFFIYFAGPGVWDSSLLRMLAWFVPHLLFCYLIGDLANGELLQRGYVVVPLVGSRLRWWWGKMVTLLLLARGEAAVGIGGGLPSRVDAVRLAVAKASDRAQGAVLASDAFFPFPDGVEIAAQAGVTAVVQPGGSVRDSQVIEAADRLGLAMCFTGVRHFRH